MALEPCPVPSWVTPEVPRAWAGWPQTQHPSPVSDLGQPALGGLPGVLGPWYSHDRLGAGGLLPHVAIWSC